MNKYLILLVFLAACDDGGDSGGAVDAGRADGSSVDVGPVDAAVDMGSVDAAVDAAPDAGPAQTNVPGRFDRTVQVGEEVREFIVYVPEAAAGSTPVPVVFMFHGTSGDGERFYDISGWKEKADVEGFIAVFPSAQLHCFYEDENRDGDFEDEGEIKVTTKWDGGRLGDEWPLCGPEVIAQLPPARRAEADHPVADDLGFVDAMIDHLVAEQAVDARRIYASGFSNGGQFTSRLALERSERFAAAACAAGSLAIDPIPGPRAVPFVFTVGERDDRFTVPYGVEALPVDETALDLLALLVGKYLVAFELAPDHTTATTQVGGRQIFRADYTTSTVGGENVFVFAVLEGLFHQYPNGDNYPLALTAPLWEFFSQYSLPE